MSYVGNKPAQKTIPVDDSVTTAMLQDDAVTSAKIDDGTITSADMAVDPRNASNLNSGDVPLAQLDNAPATDVTGLEDDIALLGFRVASNGSLAKYNLVDQTVDDFQDASGVDAGSSTNEKRNSSNYYEGVSTGSGDATGGTITYDGGKTIHTFTADGDWGATSTHSGIEWFIVAGGGAGSTGNNYNGGGGAGGYRTSTGASVTAQTYAVVVGEGGSGAGNDGGDSSAIGFTSTGGGGLIDPGSSHTGGSGAGGYGAGAATTGGAGNTPSTSPSQGNNGGNGGTYNGGGGGGGGSAAVGTNAQDGRAGGSGTGSASGGNGGAGTSSSFSGSAVTYAAGAGGAGGWVDNTGGGHPEGQGPHGSDGTGYDASGYGMGGGRNSTSGAGSDGVVMLKYVTNSFTPEVSGANLTLVSTTTAAQAAPTKGDIVLTYTNGAGTTTLDTDLTAEISADGGSTWTPLALASEGSTGSHNIATSHDVTISSTITAPYNMAYRIKTLNQSVSKTTRIQAVSLGWS